MKFLFVLVCPMLLAVGVQASLFDDNSELNFPVELKEVQGGFAEAPVIPCPRPSPKYTNLLNQLEEIKTKIQSEACQEADLTIKNLETLLGEDRKTFLELVEKGLFGEGQLSADQVKKVETYVQNIVNKAASIAGVTKNRACFDKKTEQNTLGFLSSVISEVSGAIGVLAGPFGAKISLGGKIAGSLLGSVGQIITARQTYNYNEIGDINNYFNNLCTYHDFKSELDVENDLFTRRERLAEIFARAEEYLAGIGEVCDTCKQVIADFEKRNQEEAGYDLASPSQMDEADEMPVSSNLSVEVAIEDAPLKEQVEFYRQAFEDEIRQERERRLDQGLDSIFESFDVKVKAPSFKEDEGADFALPIILTQGPQVEVPMLDSIEATVRALLIRTWAKQQAIITEQNWRDGAGRDGRGAVAEMQDEIESFLVDYEAKKYIRAIDKNLQNSMRTLQRRSGAVLMQISQQERGFNVEPDANYNPEYKKSNDFEVLVLGDAFHALYREDVDFASVLREAQIPEDTQEYILDMRSQAQYDLRNLLSDVIDDYLVVRSKCVFFTRSAFRNNRSVKQACLSAAKSLEKAQKMILAVKQTEFSKVGHFTLSLPFEATPNYVKDWLESVNSAVSRDLSYLQLQLGAVENPVK